jgi:hypothetical protein
LPGSAGTIRGDSGHLQGGGVLAQEYRKIHIEITRYFTEATSRRFGRILSERFPGKQGVKYGRNSGI